MVELSVHHLYMTFCQIWTNGFQALVSKKLKDRIKNLFFNLDEKSNSQKKLMRSSVTRFCIDCMFDFLYTSHNSSLNATNSSTFMFHRQSIPQRILDNWKKISDLKYMKFGEQNENLFIAQTV